MIAGGLFAVDVAWFRRLGVYDAGMENWGGEQIELSLRQTLLQIMILGKNIIYTYSIKIKWKIIIK